MQAEVSHNLPHNPNKDKPSRRFNKYYKRLAADLTRLSRRHKQKITLTTKATRDTGSYASYVHDFHCTNGAYHSEVRTADTWSLKTGRQVPLKALFKKHAAVKKHLTNAALHQLNPAENQRKQIKRNIKRAIDIKKFYLTPDAIVLMISNHRVFTIPYAQLPVHAHAD